MISTIKKVSLTIVMCQMVGDQGMHGHFNNQETGYPTYIYIFLWPLLTAKCIVTVLSRGGSWSGRTGCQQATRLHKQLGYHLDQVQL